MASRRVPSRRVKSIHQYSKGGVWGLGKGVLRFRDGGWRNKKRFSLMGRNGTGSQWGIHWKQLHVFVIRRGGGKRRVTVGKRPPNTGIQRLGYETKMRKQR